MRYILAVLVIFMAACVPQSRSDGSSPYGPYSGPATLVVDNRGLEDVRVYLHPRPANIGSCGSLQVCELDLTSSQADDIEYGRVNIAYYRLAGKKKRIMPKLTQRLLTLVIGIHDTTSHLEVR